MGALSLCGDSWEVGHQMDQKYDAYWYTSAQALPGAKSFRR